MSVFSMLWVIEMIAALPTYRKVLQAMAHDGWHAHRITVPGLRRKIVERLGQNDGKTTPAIDEAENHDFLRGMDMLGLLDSLFESDGMVTIAGPDGKPLDYPAQAPVLWTMRGSLSDVPLALRSRSLIFEMKKGKPRERLPRHYMEVPGLVYGRRRGEAYRDAVRSGAIVLDPDPEMPPELCRDPRLEDMCRSLLSIAGSLGVTEARRHLVEVCANYPIADVGLLMLEDIRTVCQEKAEHEHLFVVGNWTARRSGQPREQPELPAFDRIAKRALVAGVIEANPFWGSWRGANDKGAPHELTTGELGAELNRFGIYAKSIWPLPRAPGDKSAFGYELAQFEKSWAEHLDEDSTSPQASRVIRLSVHRKR
jgi:hypothetical protein